MLQASEYGVREYFSWYHSVKDFSRVEHRKRFMPTKKGLALLLITWTFVFLMCFAAITLSYLRPAVPFFFFSFLIIASIPFVLAYTILVPLLFIQYVIQPPLEYFIIAKARKILQKHTGLKIAIAGSFGKTTMREILKTVLTEGKKTAASPENWNTPLGISQFVQTLSGNEEILIFEFGEYYPGDVKKLCGLVQPDIGVITGVNETHLEKFKTLDRTTATIFELADYLKEKPTYVNGESNLAQKHARAGHILYNREGVGKRKVTDAKTDLAGTTFILANGDTRIELHSKLLGLHQIGPLATAADIALGLGLSPGQVKSGIAKTTPFDHRLEPKSDASGVITLDDSYNGNPDGVKAVIAFLASLSGHRRWYVTPGLVEMGQKTEVVHTKIGRQLAEAHIENVVLIRNSVTPYIEKGLTEANYTGKIIWFDDALAAFAALPHLTVPEDVVLLQNDWPDQYR
jgi:UDP-N-acetylmuramoyl-tripeptide--D-alanyl-D-alanine ligase